MISAERRNAPYSECHNQYFAFNPLQFRISKTGDVNLTPISCDLTPLDYYFLGAMRDNSYVNGPQTITDLKAEIHAVVSVISQQTIENVLNK